MVVDQLPQQNDGQILAKGHSVWNLLHHQPSEHAAADLMYRQGGMLLHEVLIHYVADVVWQLRIHAHHTHGCLMHVHSPV